MKRGTIMVCLEPPSFTSKDLDTRFSSSGSSTSRCTKSKSNSSKRILRSSGYTELNSNSTTLLSSEDELTPRQRL
uniref:LD26673p n=1 Tax=Drosophila melanogaster TaxID=7227 RepID=Q9VMT0_DROME